MTTDDRIAAFPGKGAGQQGQDMRQRPARFTATLSGQPLSFSDGKNATGTVGANSVARP